MTHLSKRSNIFNLLFRLKDKHLYRVYLGVAVRDLAFSASGVFEPIYLYTIFQKLNLWSPLALVAFFYAIFYLIFGFLSPLGARLASRVGFKWVAIYATPFRVSYYIILAFLPTFPILIFPALLVLIISSTLYWPGFHVFFAHIYKKDQRATSISKMHIAGTLAGAVGPVLGGAVILLFGYPTLFLSITVLLLISTFFFGFAPNIKESYAGSPLRIFKNILDRKVRRIAFSFAVSGVEDQANGVFMPLFLFLIPLSYSSIGGIMTFSLLITLVLTYAVGRASDKWGGDKILKLGSLQQAAAWIARIFIKTPLSAAVIHGAYGVSKSFVSVSFSSMLYRDIATQDGNSYSKLILREQALNFGRGVFLLVSGALLAMYSSFTIIFLVAALGALLRPLYIEGKEKITIHNAKDYIVPIPTIVTAINKTKTTFKKKYDIKET